MASTRVFPALLTALVALPLAAQGAPKALSLQEAITTALQNNLQVEIAKANREGTVSGIQSELGSYDWNLNSTLEVAKTKTSSFGITPFLNTYANVDSKVTNTSRSLSIESTKAFEWGGNLNLTYTPRYSSDVRTTQQTLLDPPFTAYPAKTTGSDTPYTGRFNASYSQSLLKGFGRDISNNKLIIARRNAQSADLTFQKAIVDLVASIETQYWDVVYNLRNLDNKKLALDLAKKQLRENKIRVEVGTMAPIEIASAESQVASREQEIYQAEADLANAKDALMKALYPAGERPSDVQPTDGPTLGRVQLTEEAAQKMAAERRLELKITRLSLDNARLGETVAANRLKPQLDVSLNYASAASNQKSLGDINSDITGSKNPGYGATVTFAVPIQNRTAKGGLSRARAEVRASELGMKDQELGIMLEVRNTLRSVEATEKRVVAAKKSREYKELDFSAEQKKFENGMSTTFVVLSKQNELDAARASELQSQISYAKAVTAFEKAVGNLLDARKLSVN